MANYEDLKKQIAELLTADASKEQIEKVAIIGKTVDELSAESDKQKSEYKGLLKDYSELIKHTAFTSTTPVEEGTEVNKDNFFKDWANKNKLEIKEN